MKISEHLFILIFGPNLKRGGHSLVEVRHQSVLFLNLIIYNQVLGSGLFIKSCMRLNFRVIFKQIFKFSNYSSKPGPSTGRPSSGSPYHVGYFAGSPSRVSSSGAGTSSGSPYRQGYFVPHHAKQ